MSSDEHLKSNPFVKRPNIKAPGLRSDVASVLNLANQHITSEMCINMQVIRVSKCRCAPPINLSFSILSRFLRNLTDFISIDSVLVSARAVLRLVDHLRPPVHLANLRLFTDPITSSARRPSQTATPGILDTQ